MLPLSANSFDLLSYMALNPGRPLSRKELLDAVWPHTAVDEASLRQTVFLLRKIVGSAESGPIKTLPGRGYQFAADVTELEPVPDAIQTPKAYTSILALETTQMRVAVHHDFEEEVVGPGHPRAAFVRGVATAIVLVCVTYLGWLGWQHWMDRSGGMPVQVVLAPMEGTTDDPVLDASLTQVLRMDLAQSPYVSLVSSATVRTTLKQMMLKPDAPLTTAIALEVCERTNSQSVLSGTIAKVGQHFLMTEEANSCLNGAVVGSARYEADKREELPRTIDRLAASLRKQLGESHRSVARFDTPLLATNTTSLEALKDYSRANLFMGQGRMADAIPLQKAALALDPHFAAAQYDLAVTYLSTGDFENGRNEVLKAYALRSMASEPMRLAIVAAHDAYCTQDLFSAERNYRSWTELYPRSVQAWNGLSTTQRDLGHHAQSVTSGLTALSLAPTNAGLYEDAAYEQTRIGDNRGAVATLDGALSHQIDGDRIHEIYLHAALGSNDSALVQSQMAWIDSHPDAAYSRLQLATYAIGRGRFTEGERMLTQVTALLRQQGLSGFADSITRIAAENLLQAGAKEQGVRLFRSVQIDPEEGDDLEALAMIGDSKTAEADLRAVRGKYPEATLWRYYWQPRVEAHIALADHSPQKAILLLEATRNLDDRGLDTRKLRGDAYLANNQPQMAEKEYRENLAHYERDLEAPAYPLSWLGLGRALAKQGRTREAADAYRQFFTLWASADPDALYLKQAKQEAAKL